MKKIRLSSGAVTAHGIQHLHARLVLRQHVRHYITGFRATMLTIFFLAALTGCEDDLDIPGKNPTPPDATVTAKAGPDQTVQVGQSATLDASGSADSEGKTLAFSWAITKKPDGSSPTLTNPSDAKPTLVADVPGAYELEVTVSSSNGQSKDKVKVTATAAENPDDTGPTILHEDILTDMVLADKFPEPAKADYIVTDNIQVKAKLTVAPGVVIEFEADKGLEVVGSGSLIANGAANQTITFTGKEKIKGFWKGISISTYSEMDYVEVAYGGSRNGGLSANVSVTGDAWWAAATLKVSNSVFSNGGGYGLALGAADVPDFTNNTFRTNTKSGLSAAALIVHKLNPNTKLKGGNGHEGVAIEGYVEHYSHSEEVVWPAFADGATYLAGDLMIESGVQLSPGVTIEFEADKGLYVRNGYGYLIAKGTAAKPITFTGKAKSNGYWKGIMIASSSSNNEFDYVNVSYGGSSSFYNFDAHIKTNIGVYGKVDASSGYASPSLTITNSNITHSGGYGLYMDKGSSYLADFSKNRFSSNAGAALYIGASQINKLDKDSRFNSSNGYNGVETEGTIAQSEELVWPTVQGGLLVHVVGDLVINSGVKILTQPGAPLVFEFAQDKALYVQSQGYLIAKGLTESGLYFKGKTTEPGSWNGIRIVSNSSLNELNRVKVMHGGAGTAGYHGRANVAVKGTAKVVDSAISHSASYGICAFGGAAVNADIATANTFDGNAEADFYKAL